MSRTKPDDAGAPVAPTDMLRKLKHLEGIVGYQFPAAYFSQAQIAKWLSVSEGYVSKKFSGARPMTESDLSVLVERYGLSPLTYEIFHLPFEAFKAALEDTKVGTFGIEASASARQTLYARGRKNAERISIRKVDAERRSGGIGPLDAAKDAPPVFRISDLVFLTVAVPGPGQLIVLNERLGGETVCLKPSSYAADLRDDRDEIRIPYPALSDYFRINPPSGTYRVTAIWIDDDEDWPSPRFDEFDDSFRVVPDSMVRDYADRLAQPAPGKDVQPLVMCTEYFVQ